MRYLKLACTAVIGLLIACLGCIVVLLTVLWIDHTRSTYLPEPSGAFAIGRTTIALRDATSVDTMAPQPNAKRELFVWIWYPADKQPATQRTDDYLPVEWRRAIDNNVSPVLRLFVTRDLSRVHAHSYRDAAVSSAQRSYPVVLLRGGAAAEVTQYTCLAEDLASHGYFVIGFDAPYRSFLTVFPDGRVMKRAPQNDAELVGGSQQVKLGTKLTLAWSSDMSYVLDELEKLNTSDPTGRFTGRFNLDKVGALGHSLGGATALQFCHDDPRCKAGIDLDGLPLGDIARSGVNQPFLFLLSDHSKEPEAVTRPILSDIRAIYDRLPDDKRLWLSIRGAGHFRFGDGAFIQFPLVLGVLHRLGAMPLDGRRQVQITEHYISNFFDVYLKGVATESALKEPSEYPEVEVMQ